MTIAEARDLFPFADGYLDTGSVGLPASTTVDALDAALREWQRGDARAPAYDTYVARSRDLIADLLSVPPGNVAVGSQVSGLVGLVAASLPDDAVVVCPEEEFTSVLFPFLAQADRGVEVRTVPLADLAAHVVPGVTHVAWSLVQSADGRIADTDAILAAAAAAGTVTLVDATQALGWHPVDANRFDMVVAGAYKWLLSPRGTAYLAIRPEHFDSIVPHHAGWYAGEDVWSSIYRPPLRLAADARRFDLSPAWLCWVGAVPALELISAVGVDHINRHNVGLANELRTAMGVDPTDSAIVTLDVGGVEPEDLSGLTTSLRAGRLRVGFHLYNTTDDVHRLVDAVAATTRRA